jgi:iron complex outermembrane recepter protein
MSNVTKLSDAIKFALFVGAASSAASVSAFAQESDEAKTLDRVEVTGSRIKRVDAETTQPVQVITRDEIQKSGATNVYDILNNITASDGSGLSTVTTATNGSDGAQNISLRGLGAGRTLVLVDGKRWISEDGIVDFTTIPVAIIERIDVLKDGASAIYGTDAIAGVINVITRKNYEGAQFAVSYGQYAPGDGAQKTAEVTVGAAGERANVVLSANFTEYEPVFAGDRAISDTQRLKCPTINYPNNVESGCGSAFTEYGSFFVPSQSAYASWNPAGNTGSQSIADSANNTPFYGSAGSLAFQPLRYNFAPINYLKQPSKITNLFGAGRFQITDNVSAYARANYTKRTSAQQLAPVPLSISAYGSYGPQWTFGASADNVFNPFGEDINFLRYRMSGAGPRTINSDHDAIGLQLGLEGSFEIGDRAFSWDLMGQRNDFQMDNTGDNYINLFNLKNALGASGYDTASKEFYCGTDTDRLANCMPFNLFQGPNFGLGSYVGQNDDNTARYITAADIQKMLNYITYSQVSTRGFTSVNYAGNIQGDLFELPGGMMSFAFGFEQRSDRYFARPDTLVASGGSSDNFTEPTSGQVDVMEYYAEFVVPLLKDVFFAKELEIKAAVRKSDYDSKGLIGDTVVTPDIGSPTTKQFGLRWKPFDDLLVRATKGETFRAPSVSDLYAGGAEGFPEADDPCNTDNFGFLDAASQARCQADNVPVGGAVQANAQLRGLFGGDPSLKPEFGDNLTVGFVYSPSWFEGFDISVDYWRIELNDAVAAYGVQDTLEKCYLEGLNSFCNGIERAANGKVITVRASSTNASFLETAGYDIGIGYRYDAGDWGKFSFRMDTTYVDKAEFVFEAGDPISDATGTYNGTPNWELRSNASINWAKGDWNVQWTTRFMSNLYEACAAGSNGRVSSCNEWESDPNFGGVGTARRNNIPNYAVHDLNVGWKAPWDATVSVGARNLFGKEPPTVIRAFAHSFDGAYDLPGGAYWYASYRQDF